MRRRSRSGGRIMLRGKPGLILLMILLVAGLFIAYYTWGGSSTPTSSAKKYGNKNRYPSRNSLNQGLRYGGQKLPGGLGLQKGPQMLDPPSLENRMFKDQSRFGGINMKPLEPPKGFDGPRKDTDDDYRFKDDGDDFDDREDFRDKSREKKEDYSKGDVKVEVSKESKFQQSEEKQGTGVPYPQLYVKPDPNNLEQFQKMEHIVHLDLKGAPPKINYMISLLPLIKKLGATGLLLEYEDMFPYHDDLRIIASESPYSTTDIIRLLNAAKNENLRVIPLIQTFGHMEFVLKYAQYQDLRENPDTPQVISPASTRSYQLIKKMIDQVMTLHSDAPFIHIGCDEVYGLGEGKSKDLNMTKEQIFLSHVKNVAGFIKEKYPKTQAIMWDDELRKKISSADIEKSGLGDLVELMVWAYIPHPKESLHEEIWVKYGKYFSGVWAASSFKGATGSAQFFTNVSYHLENHINWIQIVKEIKDVIPPKKFRGFALTGWQRYDHFAALCELLPSSVPSLAVSLQAVNNGGFTPEIHRMVSNILNCTNLLELDFPKKGKESIPSHDCKFPGSDFYYAMQSLWSTLDQFKSDQGLQSRIQGWLTDFHVRTHFSSPGHMKILQRKLSKVLEKLKSLQAPVRSTLKPIYDDNTVEEWVAVHLTQIIDDLKVKWNKASILLQEKTWNKRPLAGAPQGQTRQQQQQQQQQQIQQQQLGYQGRQNGFGQLQQAQRQQTQVRQQFGNNGQKYDQFGNVGGQNQNRLLGNQQRGLVNGLPQNQWGQNSQTKSQQYQQQGSLGSANLPGSLNQNSLNRQNSGNGIANAFQKSQLNADGRRQQGQTGFGQQGNVPLKADSSGKNIAGQSKKDGDFLVERFKKFGRKDVLNQDQILDKKTDEQKDFQARRQNGLEERLKLNEGETKEESKDGRLFGQKQPEFNQLKPGVNGFGQSKKNGFGLAAKDFLGQSRKDGFQLPKKDSFEFPKKDGLGLPRKYSMDVTKPHSEQRQQERDYDDKEEGGK